MEEHKISIKAGKRTIPLDKYAGEWIAFTNGKVVAHGGSLRCLMEKVKKLRKINIKSSIFLVPKKREGPYIL